MLNKTTIEYQLATLEEEVADLKQKAASKSNAGNWIDKLIGSISDEPSFLEALDYGRSFRQADKPLDELDESDEASAKYQD
jgi:hypothetical protein